ncbi:MAG: cytochrome-c peroxidase, partial [Flavobacteriales bacterium]|nr:cytochrome-c peroxidase [Flavobacteriales bacterium]
MSGCQTEKEANDNVGDWLLTRQLESISPTGDIDYFILPESDELQLIPQDPLNPLTESKVALGQFLFHETGLGILPMDDSNMEAFSCASCHHARAGFQAGVVQG